MHPLLLIIWDRHSLPKHVLLACDLICWHDHLLLLQASIVTFSTQLTKADTYEVDNQFPA